MPSLSYHALLLLVGGDQQDYISRMLRLVGVLRLSGIGPWRPNEPSEFEGEP